MGQTSAPVRILLTDSTLLQHPDAKPILDALLAQGHTIDTNDDLAQYHFVGGPNCWYMVPEVMGLFDLAVNQARKIATMEKKAMPKKAKVVKEKKPKALKVPKAKTAKTQLALPEKGDMAA